MNALELRMCKWVITEASDNMIVEFYAEVALLVIAAIMIASLLWPPAAIPVLAVLWDRMRRE